MFTATHTAPFAVVANRQTEGRGRHGHRWYSESDGGLYYSLLVEPKVFDFSALEKYHHEIGLRIARLLTEITAIRIDLEWPNDLILDHKKVGGVLLETTSGTPYVIIGVGLNINQTEFPDELKHMAISMYQKSQKIYDKRPFAERLSQELHNVFAGN